MVKVVLNSNSKEVKEIRAKIKENNGHCCCAIEFTPDNICMCKEFREQLDKGIPGFCGCGLYEIKVN